FFFISSRRRHTRFSRDWSSDVCSSDLSGFAYQLYDKVFNIVIGSNSRNIFSMVNPIDKDELQEGDLVFFKIKSRAISHVGVYLRSEERRVGKGCRYRR